MFIVSDTAVVTQQTRKEKSLIHIVKTLSSILSSLYAMLLVAAFVTLTAAWIVHFPAHNHEVQSRQFLVYLLSTSIAFLVYILCYLTQPHTKDIRIWSNPRSHGSAFLRQGAIIFGLGTLVYSILEFIAFFQEHPSSPCYDISHAIAYFLFGIFTILQVLIIVRYPRLNISKLSILAKFGLMHLITTNAIIWIHTVAKESMHELIEAEPDEVENNEYLQKVVAEYNGEGHGIDRPFFNNFLGDTLIKSSPYLLAFVIEFSLIGGTVFYSTWVHAGLSPPQDTDQINHNLFIPKPKPRDYISKTDWSHSVSGFLPGIMVTFINFIHLGIFFSMAPVKNNGEFISDITNTFLNILGLFVCSAGLVQIQNLGNKYKEEENGLDLSILNVSGFFMYLYSCLTIIVGFNAANISPDFGHNQNAVIIINGIIEILFVTLQITFLVNLLQKKNRDDLCHNYCHPLYDGCKPGRQAVTFLSLLNISQWINATFELQKSLASPWEKNYYGFLPWTILQRLSLPLCAFFRFHSAVINIDSWKNVYKSETNQLEKCLQVRNQPLTVSRRMTT